MSDEAQLRRPQATTMHCSTFPCPKNPGFYVCVARMLGIKAEAMARHPGRAIAFAMADLSKQLLEAFGPQYVVGDWFGEPTEKTPC